MLNKPFEYWAVVIGMALYAATRDAETDAWKRRIGKIAASGLLAVGVSQELAPVFLGSEKLAVVAVMGIGILALDLAIALLKDRAFIKELIRKKLGGSNE